MSNMILFITHFSHIEQMLPFRFGMCDAFVVLLVHILL